MLSEVRKLSNKGRLGQEMVENEMKTSMMLLNETKIWSECNNSPVKVVLILLIIS